VLRAIRAGEGWAVAAAAGLTKASVPAVVALLEDPDSAVAAAAVAVLPSLGRNLRVAAPELLRLLRDPAFEAREETALCLPLLGDLAADGIPVLVSLAERAPANEREPFVKALGEIGVPAVPALRRVTEWPDAETAVAAAYALWRIDGDAAAFGAFARRRPATRAAIFGLAATRRLELDDLRAYPEAAPIGCVLARDPVLARRAVEEGVVPAAEMLATADAFLRDADLVACLHARIPEPDHDQRRSFRMMVPRDKPSLPDLLAALDGDPDRDVLDALGAVGPAARAAAPRLRELLQAPRPATRAAAARALWKIAGDADAVRAALRDTTSLVRISALVAVADARFVPDVLTLLDDRDRRVHRYAFEALGRLGAAAAQAIPALRAIADDPGEDERRRHQARALLESLSG
jgi:hypothetical protein